MAAKRKILVVEDDESIAENLMEILELSGEYKTDTAPSADKAIKKLDEFKPDLVLLDINIQGDKDGIQVGEIINDRYNLPFIYLTAFAEKAILERAKKTFPYGYLVKPFKVDGVFAAIEIAFTNFNNFREKPEPPKTKKEESELVMGDGIFVRVGGAVRKIKFEDIQRIEADGRRISIFGTKKSNVWVVNKKLQDIEDKLPIKEFQRIHKSHIVRLSEIEAIKGTVLHLTNEVEVPLGRAYLKEVKDRLIELKG